jgi:cytochrome c oxidase subunit II
MFTGAALSTGKVDSAFFFIVVSSAVLLTIVMAAMLVVLVRYRRKRHPEPGEVRESVGLEVVWTAIPLLLVLVMFYFGWVDFKFIRNPPKNAMTVDVTARQWSWLFRYPNGKEDDVLRVPLAKPVNLVMTSLDVLHCLFIPAFRIKEDCVPGLKTHLWFQADEAGTYEIFCTEYCGAGHSHMRSSVIVLPAKDFDAWYAVAEEAGAAAQGLKVLKAKGCLGCHSVDGTAKMGPTFKGLFGGQVTVVTGGKERTVAADEAYIRSSVLDPGADVVKGFAAGMPKLPVTDDEMKAIIAALETLK